MTVGLPGTGIGGLYYLLLVCWMALRALGLWLAKGRAAPWRRLVVLLGLVGGILAALWIEAWGLQAALMRICELARAGSELQLQVEIAQRYLRPALAWVPFVVLFSVIAGAHLLRWVVRCNNARRLRGRFSAAPVPAALARPARRRA